MSLREKSAWITLLSVLLCFGAYFGAVFSGHVTGAGRFHLLLACAGALLAIQLASHLAIILRNPADARTPRDERERLIQARSHSVGYYVLIASVLAMAAPGHTRGTTVPDLLNFALLGIVLASLAVSLSQIIQFRRGA